MTETLSINAQTDSYFQLALPFREVTDTLQPGGNPLPLDKPYGRDREPETPHKLSPSHLALAARSLDRSRSLCLRLSLSLERERLLCDLLLLCLLGDLLLDLDLPIAVGGISRRCWRWREVLKKIRKPNTSGFRMVVVGTVISGSPFAAKQPLLFGATRESPEKYIF